MAQAILLASFLLGVLLVVGVIFLLSRGRYRYSPRFAKREGGPLSGLHSAVRTPVAWTVAFVLLTLLAGGATVLAVGGFGVSAGIATGAVAVLAGVGVVVLVSYVFYGTFVAARSRGLHAAQAAAFGSWAVGLLVLVAVAASLLGFV